MGDTRLGGARVLASRLVDSPTKSRDQCDRPVRHRRRAFAARGRRPHPPSRLRTGLEGLGRGVDGVTNWRLSGYESYENDFDLCSRRRCDNEHASLMNQPFVTANSQEVSARLPCTIEEFLVA